MRQTRLTNDPFQGVTHICMFLTGLKQIGSGWWTLMSYSLSIWSIPSNLSNFSDWSQLLQTCLYDQHISSSKSLQYPPETNPVTLKMEVAHSWKKVRIYPEDHHLSNTHHESQKTYNHSQCLVNTWWFMSYGHNCSRWFPRFLCSKKSLSIWVLFSMVTVLWVFFFLILINMLLWTAHTTHGVYYMLYDHQEQ